MAKKAKKIIIEDQEINFPNRSIILGDNYDALCNINSNSVDLIYVDPPYKKDKNLVSFKYVNDKYSRFDEMFNNIEDNTEWVEYIKIFYPNLHNYLIGIRTTDNHYNFCFAAYMSIRLIELHRILKTNGSLYLHCDFTYNYIFRSLLNIIFGEDNFYNEIIWCKDTPSQAKSYFPRKTDTIFWYAKNHKPKFNVNNLQVPSNWNGRGGFTKKINKTKNKTKLANNWWVSISSTQRKPKEYLGYRSQKPLKLLERIILASTDENDIVLDAFCGGCSTCVAAERLKRKWIGIDNNPDSYKVFQERIKKGETKNKKQEINLISKLDKKHYSPRTLLKSEVIMSFKTLKRELYELQNSKCLGCNEVLRFRHLTRDHIYPKSKGGTDSIKNCILLCNACNNDKNNQLSLQELRVQNKKNNIWVSET